MITRFFFLGSLAIAMSDAPQLCAAEVWSCDYSGFQLHTKEHNDFRIDGNLLFQEGDNFNTDLFYILENSRAALVAAKGGKYEQLDEDPIITSSVVMIDKQTGNFVFTLASIGPANDRTTGKCRKKSND